MVDKDYVKREIHSLLDSVRNNLGFIGSPKAEKIECLIGQIRDILAKDEGEIYINSLDCHGHFGTPREDEVVIKVFKITPAGYTQDEYLWVTESDINEREDTILETQGVCIKKKDIPPPPKKEKKLAQGSLF